nr:MAG TPA: hypothetical protein [Caudoviricetes sp.]
MFLLESQHKIQNYSFRSQSTNNTFRILPRHILRYG